jgi:hypothetical protein
LASASGFGFFATKIPGRLAPDRLVEALGHAIEPVLHHVRIDAQGGAQVSVPHLRGHRRELLAWWDGHASRSSNGTARPLSSGCLPIRSRSSSHHEMDLDRGV